MTIRTLHNETASLSVDLFGGAIKDFHLKALQVNPLSFAFSLAEMPENNRQGAPYQGHFLCLGRWGAPSDGEIRAGLPHHGQAANILWNEIPADHPSTIIMHATAPLEALQVNRALQMDDRQAVYAVEEQVTNTGALGRLYSMVQHPTLGAPFLDHTTIVDCNATTGFDQFAGGHPEKAPLHWPGTDLRTPQQPYSSVFSFIVDQQHEYGWVTAYAPPFGLLLGYVWKRQDYPWIHLWQDWHAGQIRYRGIEFGTAGIHQPFNKILENGLHVFGERTVDYIDAGAMSSRRYLSFLYRPAAPIQGVQEIAVRDGGGRITIRHEQTEFHLDTGFKNFL